MLCGKVKLIRREKNRLETGLLLKNPILTPTPRIGGDSPRVGTWVLERKKLQQRLNLEGAPLCGPGLASWARGGGVGEGGWGGPANNRWAQLGPPAACLPPQHPQHRQAGLKGPGNAFESEPGAQQGRRTKAGSTVPADSSLGKGYKVTKRQDPRGRDWGCRWGQGCRAGLQEQARG